MSRLKLPKSDKCINILIMGETGVGKSTFVNSLYNYLTYETLDDAMNGGLKILIPTSFQLTDRNMISRTIKARPNILEENHTENENSEVGQSATNNPRAYLFMKGNRKIRIIDTPGIGDTRGICQDEKNITKILAFIGQYRELHAICILLKPNEPRLTPTFRFCIDELLVHLHLSAAENILFCFTNTRAYFYKPGETLSTLTTHVNQYQQKRVELRLDPTTIFCFDNESFRFLCARAAGFNEIAGDIKDYRASWEKSVEETKKLFSLIQGRPAHKISETLWLNITKQMLSALTAPMIDIARVQMINKNIIKEKRKEIEQIGWEKGKFSDQLYYNQIEITFEQLEKPQILCTSKKCHLTFTNYGTVCVENCLLSTVEAHKCGNPKLKQFLDMADDNNCKCGCHWNQHMLLKYIKRETPVRKKNKAIRKAIELRNKEQDELRDFVKQLNNELTEMEDEQKFLMKSCALYAYTVRENALLPYNISHKEYIDFLIKQERQTSVHGRSSSTIEGLENMKQQYETEINLLTLPTTETTTTANKCLETLQELRELKHCHPIDKYISEVQQLLSKDKDENLRKDVVVNVVKEEGQASRPGILQTIGEKMRNLITIE